MSLIEYAELDALAFGFFKMFARFEYALKAAGYIVCDKDGGANPDWNRFARTVAHAFDNIEDEAIRQSVEYLLTEPPKKQVVRCGLLEWQQSPPTGPTALTITVYVRRVRNNLFHGGKFNNHWFAPERSDVLMRHSLRVLQMFLDVSAEVRKAYNDD